MESFTQNNRVTLETPNRYIITVKEDARLVISINPFRFLKLDGSGWYKEDKMFFKYEIYPLIKEKGYISGIEFIFSEYPLENNNVPGISFSETFSERMGDIDWNNIIKSVNGLEKLRDLIFDRKFNLTLISYGIRQTSIPMNLDGSSSALSFNGKSGGNLSQMRGTDSRIQNAIVSQTFMFEGQLISILNKIVQLSFEKTSLRYGIYCSKGHHRSVAVVEIIGREIFNGMVQINHPHLNK